MDLELGVRTMREPMRGIVQHFSLPPDPFVECSLYYVDGSSSRSSYAGKDNICHFLDPAAFEPHFATKATDFTTDVSDSLVLLEEARAQVSLFSIKT